MEKGERLDFHAVRVGNFASSCVLFMTTIPSRMINIMRYVTILLHRDTSFQACIPIFNFTLMIYALHRLPGTLS